MNTNWKARLGAVLLAFATVAATPSAVVAGSPSDFLRVKGVEVLPQSLNPDGAVFVYDLLNQQNRWKGFGFVVVDHGDQLPDEYGSCVPVEGGEFKFLLGWRFTVGEIWWGNICATDDPNVYSVYLEMFTHRGELLCFYGELDHRPLYRSPPSVPTIDGYLYSCYLPAPVAQ